MALYATIRVVAVLIPYILFSCRNGFVFGQMDEMDNHTEHLIDSFVEDLFQCRHIVGANLVVVNGTETLLSKGYGHLDMTKSDNITEDTMFGIASLSKAFAATLLGKLLGRHGYTWDTTVSSILGEDFCFADPDRTRLATLKDLLSHRMGISANNMIRMQDGLDRQELARRMRYLDATEAFRDSYIYNNLMYGLVSMISEKIGEDTWENLITEEIFEPLGMMSSTFTHVTNLTDANIAIPHAMDHEEGILRPVSLNLHSEWGKLGGSGSVTTNAKDMAHWLKALVGKGRDTDGNDVIPESVIEDTQTPYNAMCRVSSSDKPFLRPSAPVSFDHHTYAMGWKVGRYRGWRTLSHTGSSFGFIAHILLVPDLDIGLYSSMTGDDPGYIVRRLLHLYVLDLVLGETPWLNQTSACNFHQSSRHKKKSTRRNIRARHRRTADLVGTYGNIAYGNVSVYVNETTRDLMLKYGFGLWVLRPAYASKVFTLRGTNDIWMLSRGTITFKASSRRVINELSIAGFDRDNPPVFTRDFPTPDSHGQCGSLRVLRPEPTVSGHGTQVKASGVIVTLNLCVVLGILMSRLLINSV